MKQAILAIFALILLVGCTMTTSPQDTQTQDNGNETCLDLEENDEFYDEFADLDAELNDMGLDELLNDTELDFDISFE